MADPTEPIFIMYDFAEPLESESKWPVTLRYEGPSGRDFLVTDANGERRMTLNKGDTLEVSQPARVLERPTREEPQ